LRAALWGLLFRTLGFTEGYTDQTVAFTAVVQIAKRGREPVEKDWTVNLSKCILKMCQSLRTAVRTPCWAAVVAETHSFLLEMPAWQRVRVAVILVNQPMPASLTPTTPQ
jgi:hypothetical protein